MGIAWQPLTAMSVQACGSGLAVQAARCARRTVQTAVQVAAEGDTVVDATCGNGRDTLALARLAGAAGTVHAFDVQAAALAATRARLAAAARAGDPLALPEVRYHERSHAELGAVVQPRSASLVAFNLGYLPGADHGVTTALTSTRQAVLAALEVRTREHCCLRSARMPVPGVQCWRQSAGQRDSPVTCASPASSTESVRSACMICALHHALHDGQATCAGTEAGRTL
jgi:SAM-dependent methyltransferase